MAREMMAGIFHHQDPGPCADAMEMTLWRKGAVDC